MYVFILLHLFSVVEGVVIAARHSSVQTPTLVGGEQWRRLPCERDPYSSTSYLPESSLAARDDPLRDWYETSVPARGVGPSFLTLPAADRWVATCIARDVQLLAGRRYLVDAGNAAEAGVFPTVNDCAGSLSFQALAVDDLDDEEYGIEASLTDGGCMFTRFWIQPRRTLTYTLRTYARCAEAPCAGNFGVWHDGLGDVPPAVGPPADADTRPAGTKLSFCNPVSLTHGSGVFADVHCTFVPTRRDVTAYPYIVVGLRSDRDVWVTVVFDADAEGDGAVAERHTLRMSAARTVHSLQIRGPGSHPSMHLRPSLGTIDVAAGSVRNITLAFTCSDDSPCHDRVTYVYAEGIVSRGRAGLTPAQPTPGMSSVLSVVRDPQAPTVRRLRDVALSGSSYYRLYVQSPELSSGRVAFRGASAAGALVQHVVSLRRNGMHSCTGTLIGPTAVITAVHCVCDPARGFVAPGEYEASLGSLGSTDAVPGSYAIPGVVPEKRPVARYTMFYNSTITQQSGSGGWAGCEDMRLARRPLVQDAVIMWLASPVQKAYLPVAQAGIKPSSQQYVTFGWSSGASVGERLGYAVVQAIEPAVCDSKNRKRIRALSSYRQVGNDTVCVEGFAGGNTLSPYLARDDFAVFSGATGGSGDSGAGLIAGGKTPVLAGVLSWSAAYRDVPTVFTQLGPLFANISAALAGG